MVSHIVVSSKPGNSFNELWKFVHNLLEIAAFEFSTNFDGFSICSLVLSILLILFSSVVSGLLTGVSDSSGNAANEVGILEGKLYSI